jgi:mono/diheme cytochrome c family protein
LPIKRLFALTSLALLLVLAVSPAKDALRPYRALQRRYREHGVARAKSARLAQEYERKPVAIQQIWLPDLENRVDRCTTCHLGAADPVMKGAPGPFALHPWTPHTPAGFERFGCTSCHSGQGLATSEGQAHGTARDAGPLLLPTAYVEAGCGRCHAAGNLPSAPLLSRGRALMARSGCFACHGVRGQEAFRSAAPPLSSLPVKTGGEWLRRWLKGPREVDPNATMPNFQLTAREIEELSHYLFGLEVPEVLARRVQAAGAEPAGDAASGKKLFAESRCISCHTVEGKGQGSAPELSKVASAASRGWLLAYLRDPHAFNPRTPMPRYHLSDAESRDLVAYLEEEFRDFDAPKDILLPVRVNRTLAENGEKLFRRYGCFSCHSVPGAARPPEKFGPDLDGIGDKKATSLDFGRRGDLPRTLTAWLASKIEAPRSFAKGLKMPSYGFRPEETQAVVTALLALAAQPVPESYRAASTGTPAPIPAGSVGRLIDRYRCLSCHQIGERGGDISTAALTFEGSKVQRDWLVNYLVLSYSLRPILTERMPIFRMPREEAVQLADAIEALFVDPRVPEDPFAGRPASDADPAEGERLYVTLGCRACHIVGSSGGYFGPPLSDAASRLRPGWTFAWLKGPQRWRSDVRCPDYGLADRDALRLAAYLATLRQAPAGAARGAR